MVLGLTQPLTEMSTRNLPGGKGRRVHKADNLDDVCEPIVYNMWEPRRLTTLWPPRPVTGIAINSCSHNYFSLSTSLFQSSLTKYALIFLPLTWATTAFAALFLCFSYCACVTSFSVHLWHNLSEAGVEGYDRSRGEIRERYL
jgi:hypothetical protein